MRAWLRRHRWLGGLLAAVLLFAQTAAVVYACERDLVRLTAPSDEAVVPDGDGCAEHAGDPAAEHALLCKAHCEADRQSVNSTGGVPTLPPGHALGIVLWQLPDPAEVAPSAGFEQRTRPTGLPSGFPPLYLSLLVLRN
jgi:hypothetical protein